MIEGTWTLIATQKNNKEFIYVGYDVLPTIPVNIKFDKTNYKNTEKPIVSLAGIAIRKSIIDNHNTVRKYCGFRHNGSIKSRW